MKQVGRYYLWISGFIFSVVCSAALAEHWTARGDLMTDDRSSLNFNIELGNWSLAHGSSWKLFEDMIARHNHDESVKEIDVIVNYRVIDSVKARSLLSSLTKIDGNKLAKIQKSLIRLDEPTLFLSVAVATTPKNFQNLADVEVLETKPWLKLNLNIRADSELTKSMIQKIQERIKPFRAEIEFLSSQSKTSENAQRLLAAKLLKTRLALALRSNSELAVDAAVTPTQIDHAQSELKMAEAEFLRDQILGGSMESRVKEFKSSDGLSADAR